MNLLSLSLNEAIFLSVTSALLVHRIYNIYEVQPSRYVPTAALLFVPPLLSSIFYHHSLRIIWLSSFASFAAFYVALSTSIIVYRLSPMHPLYTYPGPVLAKISKAWLMRITIEGKMNERIKALHDLHGPYVRIGPNEISCIDMSAMQDIFGPNGMPKGPIWNARGNPDAAPMLVALQDLQEHSRQRKPWNRAFSTSAVKDYEPIVTKRVLQLADALENLFSSEKGHKEVRLGVDITEWMGYFSFDLMGDIAFGGGFELMRDGDMERLWQRMEKRVKNLAPLMHIPWATRLLLKFPSITGSVSSFRAFTTACARKRKEAGSSAKDLYFHLTNEDGIQLESPNIESILANGELAIIAGSDTAANALSGAIYYLLTHPLVLERLREEVDHVFPRGEGDAVDAGKLAGMEYLNAVINETLRLQPPLPTYTQRAPAKGSGGRWLGRRFIPEGTAVVAPIYSIHRDPSNFSPHTNEFRPARWLNKTDTKMPSCDADSGIAWHTNLGAYMPFSMGPANCAGKNLALAEMRAVIAVLVHRFDMRFAEGYDPKTYERKLEDKFIVQVGELLVDLKSRS